MDVVTTDDIPTASMRQHLLTIAAHVGGARDLSEVARGLTAAVVELVASCRVHCIFHDGESRTMWSEDGSEREWDSGRGVVGHAARHGWALTLDAASKHPEYDHAIDDPDRIGAERMLVQPIASESGEVHALLVAVRPKQSTPFDERERALCALLAKYVAPMLEHVSAREAAAIAATEAQSSPFRDQAVSDHRSPETRGDLIRVTPRWLTPAGWSLVALMLVGLAILGLAGVDHYSTGIGIVRAGNRVSLVCHDSGTIEEILVAPGDEVIAGQVLARLDGSDLRAEFQRLDADFHAQLRARMRDPSDERAGQSALALRGQLDVAASRIRQREIVAPHAGTVADLRGRPGQPCRPGDTVLTMSRPAETMELVALLPGDDRPQLEVGSVIRFALPGYRHEYQWFRITEVDDAVIGPTEVARLLGPETADLVPREGAWVIVRAAISDQQFVSDGVSYAYHDGMYGEAEVRLRREPVLHLLLPGRGGRGS